ncbi:ATP-binding protein [Kitasatospora camelliae]|uniref:ATP-binding protein n=1 Tax=Kitasatospora camelliae TaxID=3156397 RepID=A0AAU8JNQ1_9ACTN
MAISSLRLADADHDRPPALPPHRRPQAVTLRDAPASPSAVPALRRFACDTARRWEIPDEAVDRLALVVTELVTNAVLHSDSPDVLVAIEFDGAVLTVEVKDSGTWRSRRSARRIAEDDVTGGRGLDLVGRSTTWWHAFLSPLGTRVVACLAVRPLTA